MDGRRSRNRFLDSLNRWWTAMSAGQSAPRHSSRPRSNRARHASPSCEPLELRTLLTPGAKDTSFGVGGITVSPVTTTSDTAKANALQSDGRIVVAGDVSGFTNNINTSSDFAIIRYTTSGSLDTTFGNGGSTYITFDLFDRVLGMVVQNDDKIVVVGETAAAGGQSDIAVLRLNANGTIDTTFGPNQTGITRVDIFGGNDSGQSVALDRAGRIVIGGYATSNGRLVGAVVRLTAEGVFDSAFSEDGVQTYAIGTQADVATSVAINNDEQVLVAGNTVSNNTQVFHIIKFNPDGSLDTTFGGGGTGFATIAVGVGEDYARDIVWMPIGRIVVGGYTRQANNNFDFFAARFHSDGTRDTSFSTDGVATADFGTTQDLANSVAVQRDGRIVVAGATRAGSIGVFAMARWNVDGTLDPFFGTDGLVTQQVNGVEAAGLDILVAPGDSQLLYVVGWAGSTLATRDFVIMRFTSNRLFPEGNPNTVTRLYRAFNPNADYHFFTTHKFEFDNAVVNGYLDESTGRGGIGVLEGRAAGSTPLFRLYNVATGKHYYTLNILERDGLQQRGWIYEANEGFMYSNQVAGTSTIYRLYNTATGTHLYSESAGVRAFILASFATWQGHDDLGFAFVLTPSAAATAAPAFAETPATGTSTSAAASGTNVASLIAPLSRATTSTPVVPGTGPDDEVTNTAPATIAEASLTDTGLLDSLFTSLDIWGD
jgi:uncharacterized delta-60 repeat protein